MAYFFILCSVITLVVAAESENVPNYHGCIAPAARALGYCNTSLSIDERLDNLLSHLTIHEKIGLISPNKDLGTCYTVTRGVDRIGLPPYMWLVETNTAASSVCLGPSMCATTFVGPTGMAASFNRTLWRTKGIVMSTEMRALNNAHGSRQVGAYYVGLSGFGPNINIVRDPRFGRNSELPSEDPLVAGTYAQEMVQGMQAKDANGHVRMLAYLKHYTAYSTEKNRGHDSYNISIFDFFDTYLPQYERAMTKGGASGVMCSYNGENGVPSCANGWILNQILRKRWKRPDAVVMTDCGAVHNLMGDPVKAPSLAHAAAYSINNGTDIEAGTTIWGDGGHMEEAIQMGLTNVSVVNRAVRRAMRQLFVAGRFDPPETVEWTKIPPSVLNSTRHRQTNFEAAAQSFVLLKNDKNFLPLTRGTRIAVVGPNAVTRRGLLSDYYGDNVCYDPKGRRVFYCIPTIAEQIAAMNTGGITLVEKGVDVNSSSVDGIPAALSAAQKSDVVVMVLGIDTDSIEYEGRDRPHIRLPGMQEAFAKSVLSSGKAVVLVLVNGGMLGVDPLVLETSNAVIEAFYPSTEGSRALAMTLFGDVNQWGKLPVTMYADTFVDEQQMTNYNMSKVPGRTYRYYQGTPLYPFGHGLSYTTFDIRQMTHDGQKQRKMLQRYIIDLSTPTTISINVEVSNTGEVPGDEVVMLYHWVGDEIRNTVKHPVPKRQLVDFERVSLGANQAATVKFAVGAMALGVTASAGDKTVYPGTHYLSVETGVPGVSIHLQVIVKGVFAETQVE